MLLHVLVVMIVLLFGSANLFLAIYVYKKNPEARVNKNFLYVGLALFLWSFTNFVDLLTKDLFWLRASYSTGSLVPLFGIFFAYALTDKKINKWVGIFLSSICALFFIVNLFTSLLVRNLISFSDFGFEGNFGPLFPVWGMYLIFLIVMALSILLIGIRKVDDQRKKQILYYILGATAFAIWSVFVDIILPVFLGFTKLANFDSPATIFLVGFTSYAIIKYHLMGISSLLFQALIHSLVIVLIIILLLILIFVSSFFLGHLLIWPLYLIVTLISVALFFIGRLFFIEKRELENAKTKLIGMLKKSEENRIKAETERDKTATIVSSFSDGLIILDEKDTIFSINPKAEKILELETSTLLKKPFQSMANFLKAKPIASVLNNGLKNIFGKEVELANDFIIELSVIPLHLDTKDIGHLIVLHDVSREKIAEKMKSEFVSLAAHQLRTPLSAIKWSMSMLKNGDFGKLTKNQNEVIKKTFQNNEKLISVVNQLLDVTRIEEDRYLYKITKTDMGKIVNSAIHYYENEIKKKAIKVNLKKSDNFPAIMLDAEKMELAVQNLFDNAIRYSYEGGRVEINLESDGKNIEFKIHDFGIGIPKKRQDKIFTKFFRSDNAVKMNTSGSGLGLFLTKNIIEAHGGKIWFESEENVGTTFYFTLPIKTNKKWDTVI